MLCPWRGVSYLTVMLETMNNFRTLIVLGVMNNTSLPIYYWQTVAQQVYDVNYISGCMMCKNLL